MIKLILPSIDQFQHPNRRHTVVSRHLVRRCIDTAFVNRLVYITSLQSVEDGVAKHGGLTPTYLEGSWLGRQTQHTHLLRRTKMYWNVQIVR